MKNHIKTIAVFCFALLVAACGSDEQKRFEQSTRMVRDVYVSTSMTVYAGQSYYIQGVGFEKGDLLSFRSDESEVEIPVQDATPKTACIIIPEALGKGTLPPVDRARRTRTVPFGGQGLSDLPFRRARQGGGDDQGSGLLREQRYRRRARVGWYRYRDHRRKRILLACVGQIDRLRLLFDAVGLRPCRFRL